MGALAPPHVDPKGQAQTPRLRPPTLAKLSAVGWSGPARPGARLGAKALFWGNNVHTPPPRAYTNLAAPITRHRHTQSPFRCMVHYPCSTNQLIWGLGLELPEARPNCDCAGCPPQSWLPPLRLALATGPCAGCLQVAGRLLPTWRDITGRSKRVAN